MEGVYLEELSNKDSKIVELEDQLNQVQDFSTKDKEIHQEEMTSKLKQITRLEEELDSLQKERDIERQGYQ